MQPLASFHLRVVAPPLPWQVGIDRVATYFPRGSAELPDAEQVEGALEALQSGGLPSNGCASLLGIPSSLAFPASGWPRR